MGTLLGAALFTVVAQAQSRPNDSQADRAIFFARHLAHAPWLQSRPKLAQSAMECVTAKHLSQLVRLGELQLLGILAGAAGPVVAAYDGAGVSTLVCPRWSGQHLGSRIWGQKMGSESSRLAAGQNGVFRFD